MATTTATVLNWAAAGERRGEVCGAGLRTPLQLGAFNGREDKLVTRNQPGMQPHDPVPIAAITELWVTRRTVWSPSRTELPTAVESCP